VPLVDVCIHPSVDEGVRDRAPWKPWRLGSSVVATNVGGNYLKSSAMVSLITRAAARPRRHCRRCLRLAPRRALEKRRRERLEGRGSNENSLHPEDREIVRSAVMTKSPAVTGKSPDRPVSNILQP